MKQDHTPEKALAEIDVAYSEWGVRIFDGENGVRWEPGEQPYSEKEARTIAARDGLPLVRRTRTVFLDHETPWEDVDNSEWIEDQEAEAARLAQQLEAGERAQYERLKAKFEPHTWDGQ